MSDCMPCIIKALGERVGMTPFGWWEYADRVVITFREGPKITFMRDVEAEPEPVPEQPAPKAKRTRKTKK